MPVIRVNKTSDYTIMSNTHFREKEMTLKAKGLLSLMLSLPDDWGYSIAGLVALSKDGKDSVMSSLSELEQFGYLVRTRATDKHGRFLGYDYDVFESPQSAPYAEKPYTENPNTEKPYTENPPLLNTNISSTKELSTKDIKGAKRTRFAAPTVDEVRAYCLERKNSVDAERFVNYYTSNGWYVGKKKMVDWKATVRTWESNDKNKQKPADTQPEITDEAQLAFLRALRGETGT